MNGVPARTETRRRAARGLHVIGAPIALLSFVFFRVVRWLLTSLRRAHFRGRESCRWDTLAELLEKPLALPIVMVSGPRWNPHAVVATVGPFRVASSLAVDVECARCSAALWTLVVYSSPSLRTIATLDSRDRSATDGWRRVELEPGAYTIVLRYYDWSDGAKLPAIRVDGEPKILERVLPESPQSYLEPLRGRNGWFYRALHYYVFEMLRAERHLSGSFVRAEFLPVGNPETEFLFGCLDADDVLRLECADAVLAAQRLYLTLYNRASFPVEWLEISRGALEIRAQVDGFYLLRLHGRASPSALPTGRDLTVSVSAAS